MQKYLLLVDREEDILELQEAALKYFYGGEIVRSRTREDAIKSLARLGNPEIIIANLQILKDGFHSHLKDNGAYLPLIATCDSREKVMKPPELTLITTVLTRPVCPEELSILVKTFTQTPPSSPTHIPIKLKVACEIASRKFDIYLKLSGTNFVKITNKSSDFSMEEAEKLSSKGITEVYIKASESQDFLKVWENSLYLKMARKDGSFDSMLMTDSIEQVEKISRAFGWSSEALKASQKVIKDAIATLNHNERISDLLKKKFTEKNIGYSTHVGLLSYITCMMCAELGQLESQEKLVMASLMHDLSLDEGLYPDIEEWNKQAMKLSERSPEIVRYRLHPLHASQTAQTLDILPPDVDQIILQHHEAPDGSGYPKGLTANRIHYLAAVFIIAEDLISFLGDGEALETSLKDFLTCGENRYQQGNFKKIFDGIRQKVS